MRRVLPRRLSARPPFTYPLESSFDLLLWVQVGMDASAQGCQASCEVVLPSSG